MIHAASDHQSIRGYYPREGKEPSTKLWKRGLDHGTFVPRRDTKEGRELSDEFKALPRWTTKDLAKLAGYSDMFHESTVYFFSYFSYSNGFCGMKVPVFDAESYKRDSRHITYKPVKGMKEISWKTHNKKSAMTKQEYLLASAKSKSELRRLQTMFTKPSTQGSTTKNRVGTTRTKERRASART